MTSKITDNLLTRAFHPLMMFLIPGFLSLAIAPAGIVFGVIIGLLIFSLPGFFLARLLLKNQFHNHFFWFVAIPVGYLVSTAFSLIIIATAGFQPWLCLLVSSAIGISGIPLSAKFLKSPSKPERSPDTPCLVAGLLIISLVVGLLVIPYSKVGLETEEGVAYRAYYSGDYLKHVAITAELARGVIPPDNPYYAGEKLHYYWMFYIFPAIMTKILSVSNFEPVLKIVNLYLAAVFLWLWFFTMLRFVQRNWIRFLVILTPVFFASFEGIAVLNDVRSKGWPWGGFRAYNIDGYSRWILGQPEIDTIFRLMQYNMQHIIPAALFLVFLNIFSSLKQISRQQALIMGLLCGLTIGQSGFLGSFLTLWTGICLVILGPWTKKGLMNRVILSALMGMTPVIALFLYKTGFQMLGSAGNPLALTIVKPVTQHPLKFLLLNFGIAVIGIPAIFNWKRFHRPAIILGILAFIWITFIFVPDWPSDVGVKVGYTLAISLVLLIGQLLDQVPEKKWLQIGTAAIVFLLAILALPSIVTEVFNSSDIKNERFLSLINPVDMEAYKYMNEFLPYDACIQTGPATEKNAPFSPIPAFACRHTYCGDWMHSHIFLIPESFYRIRLDQITRMFTSDDPVLVHKLCRGAGITHLYWGANEFQQYGSAIHLLKHKDLFSVEWSNVGKDAQIYLLKIL